MRKALKIAHTLATCGIIGGLFAYMLLLVAAPQGTPVAYADLRGNIALISNVILVPSLGIALVSGLLAMAVHRPFLDKRWAWVKAAMGILMFKAVLTVVGSKADYAAALSAKIVAGTAPADALETALAHEWQALWTVLALSVANVVLGVWRPRLKRAHKTVSTDRPSLTTQAAGSAHGKPVAEPLLDEQRPSDNSAVARYGS